MKELPIIGKTYDYFDDGKIKPSRRDKVKILGIFDFFSAHPDIVEDWSDEVLEYDWLYATETDYFIIGFLEEVQERVTFVRDVDGGWCSLGYWGGRLDIDGSLWNKVKEYFGC